jgi:hypothetical protein
MTISANRDILILHGGGSIKWITPKFGGGYGGILFLIAFMTPASLVAGGNIQLSGGSGVALPVNRVVALIYSKRGQQWFVSASTTLIP